jgi:hypothetical protein
MRREYSVSNNLTDNLVVRFYHGYSDDIKVRSYYKYTLIPHSVQILFL